MDFKDNLLELSAKVAKLRGQIATEEAAKRHLFSRSLRFSGTILPTPPRSSQNTPATWARKKEEKIDYAILKDGAPVLLTECKHSSQNLDQGGNQLFRYFGTSKAKYAVLTNGVQYRFFSDLEADNVMDRTPFLEIDITNIKDNQIEEVKKFHKSYFHSGNIRSTAVDLRYINDFRKLILKDINNPSDDIVYYYGKIVYPGQMTSKMREHFAPP